MTKWISLMAVIATAVLYQNCSGRHEEFGEAAAASANNANQQFSLQAYEATLFPIMTGANGCAGCHGVSQQPLHSIPDAPLAHNVLTSFGLIDLESPGDSPIVEKIRNGHQGFDQAFADQMEAAIQDWADGIIARGGFLGTDPDVLAPNFTAINNLILQPKCVSCHSPDGVRPAEDYTDYITTINTGKIEPGDPNGSQMLIECQTGDMPQNGDPLTPQELAVIRTWIENGALNN